MMDHIFLIYQKITRRSNINNFKLSRKMCGVTGIIDFMTKSWESKEINYLTNSLNHRGPDGSNYFINDDMNVGLGHTRLSILDVLKELTKSFLMTKLSINFNGEIYNFVEIKKNLRTLVTNLKQQVILKYFYYLIINGVLIMFKNLTACGRLLS